ncbi:DNA ligase [Paenibacillus sp. J2TS4]|uniref:ATP-dependent DNA ligase n=1 Tax=Paenibacillus sp. J2TS4 TaxID=2807194 RepID=UPI001B058B78|nr:DNA ligase [Paenibacillus sp. J2TS4]GIP34021.1 hypothetical protein J2TS4_32310 [Paenibacillus sp. J2TS4]
MRPPFAPMAPILREQLPEGPDWGYQLKWDGVRLITEIHSGQVQLYSRKMLNKNTVYPELTAALSEIGGSCVLDGEAVVFDPVKQRPVFQKVLQRERMRNSKTISDAGARQPVQYVLFDLLQDGTEDLSGLPYRERHERLQAKFPDNRGLFFVTDLYEDGTALWQWVEERQWEGIVCKRLTSPYREDKMHSDWYKKKTALQLEVTVVGVTIKEGRLASLVMIMDGMYLGKVSSGLNEQMKRQLLEYALQDASPQSPFASLQSDLKRDQIIWLSTSFPLVVTGQEITDGGLLRHSKIVTFGPRIKGS